MCNTALLLPEKPEPLLRHHCRPKLVCEQSVEGVEHRLRALNFCADLKAFIGRLHAVSVG